MKALYGSFEELSAIEQRINDGLTIDVPGYQAEHYAEVQQSGSDYFLLINESDERNPLAYLTEEEVEQLRDCDEC